MFFYVIRGKPAQISLATPDASQVRWRSLGDGGALEYGLPVLSLTW